jgi:hypothetical protein
MAMKMQPAPAHTKGPWFFDPVDLIVYDGQDKASKPGVGNDPSFWPVSGLPTCASFKSIVTQPMETPPDNLAIALDAFEKGIVAIPLIEGTKIPAVKWKEWQHALPPIELVREWFRHRCNVAILCTGMVLFDCETPEKAEVVLRQCGDTPYKVRTGGGGVHLAFRRRKGSLLTNQVRIKGLDIDIRTDGGLAIIPNSVTTKGRYEWLTSGLLPISELPVAHIGWTRERKKKAMPTIEIAGDHMVERARSYLACVEGAISGQGGHNTTFRVACKLTHFPPLGFGLGLEQAWPLLKEWNEQCEPPWSDRELLHKLEDAIKKRK